MRINNDRHEDTLLFLEDNISKLVKLKVASRTEYKNYDECYLSYLTATNIRDAGRVELYGELLEQCFAKMRNKLKKAFDGNPELLTHNVVKEYAKLIS